MAVAGILDAAEGRLGRRYHHVVDRDHAGLERVADRGRGLRGGRERVGGEAEFERNDLEVTTGATGPNGSSVMILLS